MALSRIKHLLFGRSKATDASSDDSGWSIGNPEARHPYAIAGDHPAANRWFNALAFHATFQLRTPKRIIERNGVIIPLTANPSSDFEPWMGVWFPINTGHNVLADFAPKAWAEMEANRTVASDAGPVKPAEYMPFLIAFRTIVEDGSATIAERMTEVEALFREPKWASFVAALQGAECVCARFFPTVLSRINGLPHRSRIALSGSDIQTVAALRAADDATLLAFTGIGPAKLASIRQFCDAFDGDPHADRLADIAL